MNEFQFICNIDSSFFGDLEQKNVKCIEDVKNPTDTDKVYQKILIVFFYTINYNPMNNPALCQNILGNLNICMIITKKK